MRSFTDLVAFTATSAGTVAFVIGPALTGFRGQDGMTDGATYSYSVQQDSNYEIGYGVYDATAGTLSRQPKWSSNGNAPVNFLVNASVCLTWLAEDIADLLEAAKGADGVAAAAATAYGLQWAIWFNGTPEASELLGLYVSPIAFQYPANFARSVSAPPVTNPAADMVFTIDRQVGGSGAWTTIGTITVTTLGIVTLATTGGAAINIAAGDRLRYLAPSTKDTAITGFATTLKGIIA